jgi:hypothetical protein
MKTQTYKISQYIPALTGEAHVQKITFPKSIQEVTFDEVWPRIIVLLGNSRQKVWAILTPGGEPTISDADIDRMELAIREPFLHMDMLFGHKWTIPLFRATREKASQAIGVRHTPELLDAERRLDLLFQIHGVHLYSDPELRTAAKWLAEKVTSEDKKSVHIWDEITHKLLQTPDGRKLFRQLRPLYLEKQRKKEEAELQEFRSIDILFQRLLAEIRPTNVFIGSPEKGWRFEIYARHISKIAWDSNPKLSKPVRDISASSVTLNLKSYIPIESNFEV